MLRGARWCCCIAGCGGRVLTGISSGPTGRGVWLWEGDPGFYMGYSRVLPARRLEEPEGGWLGFEVSHPLRTERGMDGATQLCGWSGKCKRRVSHPPRRCCGARGGAAVLRASAGGCILIGIRGFRRETWAARHGITITADCVNPMEVNRICPEMAI